MKRGCWLFIRLLGIDSTLKKKNMKPALIPCLVLVLASIIGLLAFGVWWNREILHEKTKTVSNSSVA
jgi:hypothetical protein